MTMVLIGTGLICFALGVACTLCTLAVMFGSPREQDDEEDGQ